MQKLLIYISFLLIFISSCGHKLQKIDVDCSNLELLLEEIYAADQKIRKDIDISNVNLKSLEKSDRINLGKVVSIIEQCGMPTSQEVKAKHVSTIFLVIQHSRLHYQKVYLPMLEESANNGDLSKGAVAMLKDRIRLNEGKSQIYGTQLIQDLKTNKWKLYDLEDPEYVDKRRREVGLGSIHEYLANYDIEYAIQQKE